MSHPVIQQLQKAQHQSILPNENWRRKKALGLSYFRYRLFRPLIKLVFYFFRWWHRPAPWFAPSAVNFLKGWLHKDMVGLEFGSGTSSWFFARRIQQLVSVEHHEGWYHQVQAWIRKEGIENIEYKFIPERPKLEPVEEVPGYYQEFGLSPDQYPYKKGFWDYFHVAKNYPDEHFDFVLVDGRARLACLLTSLPKLKKGGLMILDNSDRESYRLAFEVLRDWEHFTCTTGLSDTTFWIKP